MATVDGPVEKGGAMSAEKKSGCPWARNEQGVCVECDLAKNGGEALAGRDITNAYAFIYPDKDGSKWEHLHLGEYEPLAELSASGLDMSKIFGNRIIRFDLPNVMMSLILASFKDSSGQSAYFTAKIVQADGKKPKIDDKVAIRHHSPLHPKEAILEFGGGVTMRGFCSWRDILNLIISMRSDYLVWHLSDAARDSEEMREVGCQSLAASTIRRLGVTLTAIERACDLPLLGGIVESPLGRAIATYIRRVRRELFDGRVNEEELVRWARLVNETNEVAVIETYGGTGLPRRAVGEDTIEPVANRINAREDLSKLKSLVELKSVPKPKAGAKKKKRRKSPAK